MEMSQGNSLYSHLKQTKMSFYFLLFYKIVEQVGGTGPVWGVGISGRREDVEKGSRRVDIAQMLCTHAYKWKMRPVESTLR
jgi:hypothetical protein